MQIHHPGEAHGGAWMAYQDREGRPCWHNTATNQWTYNLISSVGDGGGGAGGGFYSPQPYAGGFLQQQQQMPPSPGGMYSYTPPMGYGGTASFLGGTPTMTMGGGWPSMVPATPPPFGSMMGYSGDGFMAPPSPMMVSAPAPAFPYMGSGGPMAFVQQLPQSHPQPQPQDMPNPFQFPGSSSGMMPGMPTSTAAAVAAATAAGAAGMFGGPPMMNGVISPASGQPVPPMMNGMVSPTPGQPVPPMLIDPNGPHAAMLFGPKPPGAGRGFAPPFPIGDPRGGQVGPMPPDPSSIVPEWLKWPGLASVGATKVMDDDDDDDDDDGDGDRGEGKGKEFKDDGGESAPPPAEEAPAPPPEAPSTPPPTIPAPAGPDPAEAAAAAAAGIAAALSLPVDQKPDELDKQPPADGGEPAAA